MIDGKGCAVLIGIGIVGFFLLYCVINTINGWL